jgi:hypothetical protein
MKVTKGIPWPTRRRRGARILIAGGLLVAMATAVVAQSSSATYNVPRQSIDGGAQRAASATYGLNGTIGQPDAGPAMSGATFSVRGGFHRATAGGPQPDPIFANGFEP